ncbi:DNA-processing protein DprA [Pseudomonadota bacterium]
MYDNDKNAILLLCSYFSGSAKSEFKPLTPVEYGRLSRWMKEEGKSPAGLMRDLNAEAGTWHDPKGKITLERLRALFDRSMELALAVEKWNRSGIWAMVRGVDRDYPRRLWHHLGFDSPALLYGLGNRNLLRAGGLCVIGSRGICAKDRNYAQFIGRQAALEGLNVVSGGAKGVDETAMFGALEAGGTAIGVLADSLAKAGVSSKWRRYLMSNELVLISTSYPDARFNVGAAMGRNKYIYCLSDYGLVVRSDEGSGGTWAGATENLRKGWVPLFVKEDSTAPGNAALIKAGAQPLRITPDQEGGAEQEPLRTALGQLDLEVAPHEPVASEAQGQSTVVGEPSKESPAEEEPQVIEETQAIESQSVNSVEGVATEQPGDLSTLINESGPELFYRVFCSVLESRLEADGDVTLKALESDYPNLVRKQFVEWLQTAVEEGVVVRPGKPHKYLRPPESEQLDMLSGASSED